MTCEPPMHAGPSARPVDPSSRSRAILPPSSARKRRPASTRLARGRWAPERPLTANVRVRARYAARPAPPRPNGWGPRPRVGATRGDGWVSPTGGLRSVGRSCRARRYGRRRVTHATLGRQCPPCRVIASLSPGATCSSRRPMCPRQAARVTASQDRMRLGSSSGTLTHSSVPDWLRCSSARAR
jgi:hypothetical protein